MPLTLNKHVKMKKRIAPITLLASYLAGFFVLNFLLFAPPAQAQSSKDNRLGSLAAKCGNMKKQTDGWGVANGTWGDCEDHQKWLHEQLDCSDKMFYARADEGDETHKYNDWYTKEKEFNECYKKASGKLDKIKGTACESMIKGSPKWDGCVKEQDRLKYTFGFPCENLFISAGSGRWTQSSVKINTCRAAIDGAGALGVLLPNSGGKRSTSAVEALKKEIENGGSASDGTGDEAQADCDATEGVALSWIICPVVDLGVNFTDWVFGSFIEPMLANVPVSAEKNDGAFIAWGNFRILANVLLVGALMAIVYSQAKGGGGK